MQYANPAYYWGYDSKAFRDLAAKHAAAGSAQGAQRSWAATCRSKLAEDAVNAYIFNPAQVAVASKGLKGLWSQLADLRQRHGRGDAWAVRRSDATHGRSARLSAAELLALYAQRRGCRRSRPRAR